MITVARLFPFSINESKKKKQTRKKAMTNSKHVQRKNNERYTENHCHKNGNFSFSTPKANYLVQINDKY